ncbi:uncharacterized protein LOC134345105 [Mobula hypostoma]|uniref:uncharacterized protein LOC134345105 n=1 Tax=Mobula hypostoma TaxID=723540 RepID=UPI002FC393E5
MDFSALKVIERGKRGGGVALLVRDTITATERVGNVAGSSFESVWVEVRNRKGAVTLLGGFYRPPGSSRDTEEQIGRQILERCKNNRVVIMGDFNFPNIDWHLISSKGLDGAEFVKCVQDGFLSQYVDRPTRGNAILDLVLGNKPGQVTDPSVSEHLGDSDHRCLAFIIIMEKDRIREDRKIFSCGRANYEAIRLELAGVNWDDVFAGKCTMDMWSMFRDLLQDVRDKFVPVRKIRNGKVKEPWVTSEVKNLVRWKKAAYMRIRKQGSDGSIEEYRVARKELKKRLRRARRELEKALASRVKENPKAFFNYVKN